MPYDTQQHHPLASYGALAAVFAGTLGGGLLAARARGLGLPPRVTLVDIAVGGLATHKLSRLIAKDRVTQFLRAPFTEYEGSSGHGEVEERARGRGMQRAVGELLICPYCLAQWVAAAWLIGIVHAPRATRLLSAMWAAHAVADAAQLAYSAAEERS